MSTCCICGTVLSHPRDEYGPLDAIACRSCWFENGGDDRALRLTRDGKPAHHGLDVKVGSMTMSVSEILEEHGCASIEEAMKVISDEILEKEDERDDIEREIDELEEKHLALRQTLKALGGRIPAGLAARAGRAAAGDGGAVR